VHRICAVGCRNIFGIGSVFPFLRRTLLATGLFFIIFQEDTFAADQAAFLSFDAEYYYRTAYPGLKGHKAFAIGPQAAYGYSWSARNSKEASNLALKYCNIWVAKQKKHGISGKCRLYAVDGKLVAKDPRIGLAWHEPAAGEDIPLNKGFKSFHIGSKPRGVVLHLHGCNGMGWNRYAEIWGSFFNAQGYDFFAPDSFAEPRPAEVCGSAWTTRARDQTIILKLRVAQTLRSIAELKMKYPGIPIFVWGHSEGGSIVKYLNVDVAGIISSGDECHASGLRIAAPASVPVLYLLGENDPHIEGSKLPLKEKEMRKCRNYVRNKKTKVVIIRNSKHEIWPWRPEVAKAMSEFIGAKPFTLAKLRPAEKLTLTERQKSDKALYQKSPDHKAFAINLYGTFAWSSKWDFVEDAKQFVLYDCARFDKINVFKLSTHACSLIDVNGKDLTAP
jgi:dienelactone hydrolase